MEQIPAVVRVLLMVLIIPTFAWLGAVLTGERGCLRGFVIRRFRLLVVVIVVGNLAASEIGRHSDSLAYLLFRLLMMAAASMMFMPVVRRAERQTENA